MNELLLNAQRARFGQSSEKREYVIPEGQERFALFNEAEAEQNVKAEEPTEETFIVAAHERKKKRTIEELAESLPVDEIVIELPEEQRGCSKCGGVLKLIGKKFVRQEIHIIPQQIYLVKYFSSSYACENCEKNTGYAHIVTTVTPPPLLKHSLASPATVADVMTKKYVDGLPLARQEKIWKRYGVELSRATLANWVIQTSQSWLKPLYRRLKKHLLEQNVIHADETVVQVLKEPDKPATSESRMWLYASGKRDQKPIRYFEYQPDRSGENARRFLKDFNGCLVTDGYSGYNKVDGVTRFGCWTHTQRKWREAMPKGATAATSKAAVGYDFCNKLFALERKLEKLDSATRRIARQVEAVPLLEAYWLWLDTLDPAPGSKLENAAHYSLNQKEYLSAFLEHGNVDISNNLAENAIRPFVVGRKNWLFCDTVKGADSSAIVYSLVETAKANEIEPYRYLLYVLSMLPYIGTNPSNAQLDQYMPWNPELRDELKRSRMRPAAPTE
jgi:transposase